MSDFNEFQNNFDDLLNLIKQTTDNLKRMAELQRKLHIQFGDGLNPLIEEMDKALVGWISSNC